MSAIQTIEIEKLRPQIEKDVHHLVDKYRKIMDWDVPENDEAEAQRLILREIGFVVQAMQSVSG